ncbi:MAG: hypothetical protein ACFE8B_11490 [Candidatus Hermodarchaeota archaeon]
MNQIESLTKKDNFISDLVSELFDHIDSKDSFNIISDLLITSLSIYKKKFSVENNLIIPEKTGYLDSEISNSSFQQNFSNAETEYLSISNDIHSILANCPDLSSDQKLDYCNSQRYFMKMYLKEIVVKLKKL